MEVLRELINHQINLSFDKFCLLFHKWTENCIAFMKIGIKRNILDAKSWFCWHWLIRVVVLVGFSNIFSRKFDIFHAENQQDIKRSFSIFIWRTTTKISCKRNGNVTIETEKLNVTEFVWRLASLKWWKVLTASTIVKWSEYKRCNELN